MARGETEDRTGVPPPDDEERGGTPPPDDPLKRLGERLEAASDAAERLMDEAAARISDRVKPPTSGWQTQEQADAPARPPGRRVRARLAIAAGAHARRPSAPLLGGHPRAAAGAPRADRLVSRARRAAASRARSSSGHSGSLGVQVGGESRHDAYNRAVARTWILTGSPENYAATEDHGFSVIGHDAAVLRPAGSAATARRPHELGRHQLLRPVRPRGDPRRRAPGAGLEDAVGQAAPRRLRGLRAVRGAVPTLVLADGRRGPSGPAPERVARRLRRVLARADGGAARVDRGARAALRTRERPHVQASRRRRRCDPRRRLHHVRPDRDRHVRPPRREWSRSDHDGDGRRVGHLHRPRAVSAARLRRVADPAGAVPRAADAGRAEVPPRHRPAPAAATTPRAWPSGRPTTSRRPPRTGAHPSTRPRASPPGAGLVRPTTTPRSRRRGSALRSCPRIPPPCNSDAPSRPSLSGPRNLRTAGARTRSRRPPA